MSAKKVLGEMRAQFDYVIVDSSPLLAVTDAAILAAGADGVLVMARFGQTKRDQLTHAVANLQAVGASLLGAVFTLMPARGNASYSYSYYGDDARRSRPERSVPAADPNPPASSTEDPQPTGSRHGASSGE
jgi:receptor protein-tyrosine kinase